MFISLCQYFQTENLLSKEGNLYFLFETWMGLSIFPWNVI